MSDWTEGAPDRLRVGMQVRTSEGLKLVVGDVELGTEHRWKAGTLELRSAGCDCCSNDLGHVIAWRQLVEVPE